MRAVFRLNREGLAAAVVGWCVALIAGCQHTINPFLDDLPVVDQVTTASVEGARTAPRKPSAPRRDFAAVSVEPQPGTVSHWPLWWQDPFEDKGSEDDRFAWTVEDYFAMCYGPARFLLNTMAFPISAYVTRPGTVMCSDGKLSRQLLGYDHDPMPCRGGAMPPIDILEIGTYQEEAPADAPTEDAQQQQFQDDQHSRSPTARKERRVSWG